MPAGELSVGDWVDADGKTGLVEAIEFVYEPQWMYNLTVDTAHTYFVGEGRWLVHNGCGKVPLKGGGTDLPKSFPGYTRGTGKWVNVDEIEVFHGPEGKGGVGFDVATLKKNITNEGFDPQHAIPVAITQNGRIILGGGHHRLEAVKQLGYTQIPARVIREEVNDPNAHWFRILEQGADSYNAQ